MLIRTVGLAAVAKKKKKKFIFIQTNEMLERVRMAKVLIALKMHL